MINPDFLSITQAEFRSLKGLADRALAQVGDADFFATLDAESNSLAFIVKHVAGNLRSRWTDFLTSDGEKPDRKRDSEFEQSTSDSRTGIMAAWEEGWKRCLASLEALQAADLDRTVTIRNDPLTAQAAVQRSLAHTAYHMGQIVFLSKHYAGKGWKTLSIPRKRA